MQSKKQFIAALVVIAVIGILSAVIYASDSDKRDDNRRGDNRQQEQQAEEKVDTLETDQFSLYAPDDAKNDSKYADESGSISYELDKDYGKVKVDLYTSSLDFTNQRYNVQISEINRTIADQDVQVTEINYASSIRGNSNKELLRYGYTTRDLEITGSDEKGILSIDVLSKRDLTASELREFKALARQIMDGVTIKANLQNT